MLGEPVPRTGSKGALVVGLVVAALLIGGAAWWLLRTAPPDSEPTETGTDTSAAAPEAPSPPASDDENADAAPTERETAGAAARTRPPAASARPAEAPSPAPSAGAPTLRVESDVPGAMVFLNRKYLGVTPLVSRDVSAGTHQLNVQVEGRDPVVQTIEVQPAGDTRIAVELAASRLDARVPVVHKHGVGSCEGTLVATPEGLTYQTSHAKDGFTLPFAQLETFTVDYLEKQLRVKQRGGRTWNFTTKDENADPLFVFHKEVEAAR